MALQALKILLVAFVGLVLVSAQNDGRYKPTGDDGRYRPSNDGRYSGNDGRYSHDDNPYLQTAGGSGASGATRPAVVNIGRNRPTTPKTITTVPPTTTASPPLARPPPPRPFFIDSRSNADAINQENAAPGSQDAADPVIKILRQEQEETADGYHYLYETENGILAEQTGQIEKTAEGDDVIRTSGFYQYIGDDGKEYRVDYVADINGFVATGEHLPTPPPIPPEIQELLNQLATKPPDA